MDITPPQPTWIEPSGIQIPEELKDGLGGHPFLPEALARRGITTLQDARAWMDPSIYRPSSPSELPDLDRAVERVLQAIRRSERIGVWGDFDVDGQTATALLVSSLRRAGALIDYYVPVRSKESHGVALPSLESFLDRGVQLLLTCDTGITAHQSVDYAASRGVETIITDHHTLPHQLPGAFAVVNPQRLEVNHPLHTLCGVGTAYQLMAGLYSCLNQNHEMESELDLVALGTVADLASLTGDNHWLVQRGLVQLRRGQRTGLKAMLELSQINPEHLNEEHIGFMLAPRLNAAGRLADANPVVEFLMDPALEPARTMALRLDAQNARRKLLVDSVYQAALSLLQQQPDLLKNPVLVISHPLWPAGVIGIVASRLVELFSRPVILLSAPPGENARGSARSIAGIDITAAIRAVSHLLAGFGGHPMAAGLSLPEANIPAFCKAIGQEVDRLAGGEMPAPALAIDAYLPLSAVNFDLVQTLDQLGPFGQGCSPFLFAARALELKDSRVIGRSGEHLRLMVSDLDENTYPVLWWQGGGSTLPAGRFDLAYRAHTSNYRGQPELQLEFVAARPSAGSQINLTTITGYLIEDLRLEPDPLAALLQLDRTGWAIWQEGAPDPRLPAAGRSDLQPASTLAVLTVPPGRSELLSALQAVQPRQVVLCAVQPESDELQSFLTLLGGLVRHGIRSYAGQLPVNRLAARAGQKVVTVIKGLEWLAAAGHIRIEHKTLEVVTVTAAGTQDPSRMRSIEAGLNELLKETAAFRKYYLRADANLLLG